MLYLGIMHNKFMVIDANGSSPRVITGSMNWSASGDDANDENTLIIRDGTTAQQYLVAFQELYDALGADTLCVMGGEEEFFLYLPQLRNPPAPPAPSPTPTNTPPPTSTAMPTATPSPTPTSTPMPQSSGDVNIIDIFFDGAGSSEPDEYVQIRNDDTVPVQLGNWTFSDAANHVFTFPNFIMQPGQTCRVYTNQNHPQWCGFNYGSGTAIWNNSGDCATLKNSGGGTVDTFCY
jgi:hypothetical protein